MTPESQILSVIGAAVIAGLFALLNAISINRISRQQALELISIKNEFDEETKATEHINKIAEMVEIERVKSAKEILDKTIEHIAKARTLHNEYPKHLIEMVSKMNESSVNHILSEKYMDTYLEFKNLDNELISLAFLWFTTDSLRYVHWFQNSNEIEAQMQECYGSVVNAIYSVRKALIKEYNILSGHFLSKPEGNLIFADSKGEKYDKGSLKQALEECITTVLADIDQRKNMTDEVRKLKSFIIR